MLFYYLEMTWKTHKPCIVTVVCLLSSGFIGQTLIFIQLSCSRNCFGNSNGWMPLSILGISWHVINYYFCESILDLLREHPLASSMKETYNAWKCLVLHSVQLSSPVIIIKSKPIYIFLLYCLVTVGYFMWFMWPLSQTMTNHCCPAGLIELCCVFQMCMCVAWLSC